MKNMNRFRVLALLLVLALTVSVFAACGGETVSANADYTVKLVDAIGNPYTSGIVVKFMQDGNQAAMQVVGANGEATKNLPRGNYTVELQFTDDTVQYVYDTAALTLTAEATSLEIVMSKALSDQTQELSTGTAHYVSAGCTGITLDPQNRSYYIFVPQEVGKYEVSLVGSDAPIGYYGGSIHYVWDHSAEEVIDNKFSIDIKQGNLGGTIMIIGVDAGEGNAILSVQNIGQPDWSVEDEPWTVYAPTQTPQPYVLPAGTKLEKFDVTASTDTYALVLDENGFYHLGSADGALVYVQLGNTSEETEYLPPFETILEKQGIRRYFFDDNGEFLKKEEYSECVLKYIENVDEATGVYPLTEDLKYIIQQQGAQAGWFVEDGAGYLFVDENGNNVIGINNEISWLFMCRYAA